MLVIETLKYKISDFLNSASARDFTVFIYEIQQHLGQYIEWFH